MFQILQRLKIWRVLISKLDPSRNGLHLTFALAAPIRVTNLKQFVNDGFLINVLSYILLYNKDVSYGLVDLFVELLILSYALQVLHLIIHIHLLEFIDLLSVYRSVSCFLGFVN